MTPERWQQIKDIFDRTVECSSASRLAYIGEHCAGDEELRREVESLLASDTPTGSLLYNPLVDTDQGEARGTHPRSLEGRLIGPYRMQREIGRGGMGVVYLASRADRAFQRLVAIKVVNISLGSPETLSRFEQEREILASLDHPNIARLIDGGTTPDGLSYLVMEYVEGHAIDVYCDEHKLDIPARLQLFRTVCAAVEYAHQKHIIHRDIKPANILVTADGTVKLLDFGIAKLMPGRDVESTLLITRTGLRLMTPEYASPEQIRGEAVATATDVYALGVVLYELLTGHLPYRLRSRIFHEIVRVVCEEPPTRPSTVLSEPNTKDTRASGDAEHITRVRRTSPADLQKCLSGDLDGIILKALEKQPYDRYRSASSLSDDIAQHLEGRPVVARQATLGYRAGKFMRRNLPWMLLLLALAAALVSGGITINRTGMVVIGGCLLAAGLWYAAINQTLSRRIAESRSPFARILDPFLLVSALAVFVYLMSDVWPRLTAAALVIMSTVALRHAVGWLGRRRYSGALLLDLTTYWRGYRFVWLIELIWLPILLGVISSGQDEITRCSFWATEAARSSKLMEEISDACDFHPFYLLNYMLLCGLLLVHWYVLYAFLAERLEIRVRGIVYCGTLYSWERIESYEWSENPRKDWGKHWNSKDYLKLRLRGGIRFFPPVRIFVPPGRRAEVDAIMSRYLSEWPATERSA